jgi:NCS1 family nucleobase:cation symporter-1
MQTVSPNTPSRNAALTPLTADERPFGFREHLSLWLSLGVGLLVMQVGAYLVPAVGVADAAWMILLGSVIGAGLLAWTARLGCASGLASSGLMHATYGSAFARLPIALNVLQLIGWTSFEIVVMREGTVAIARQSGVDLSAAWWPVLITLLWGGVLALLLGGSMVTLVRRFVGRFGLPLVLLSLVWLSWQFLGKALQGGFAEFWNRPGKGGMSTLAALDLVIAMPISWLPLVADFSRHGRSPGGTQAGTWIGYAIANAWCYGLGVVVALTMPGTELVTALLLAQGGLIALGLILIDEVDNAYGDLYSGSMAAHSLAPRWPARRWALLLVVVCTAAAMVLPMHSLEPFLLMLSSVFVPLYGVILARLTGVADVAARVDSRRIDPVAVLIWVLGIVVFHTCSRLAPQWGAAIPTLLFTGVLAALTRPSSVSLQLSQRRDRVQ